MTPTDTDNVTPIPTDKARQGRGGFQVLMVLVGGLLLAMIVWAGVEFYGEAIDPPVPATQQAPAQN